ncbi:MAG: FHA domain-containing protein [Verrucomicrobia bacterium]|nr:FHA domain-containing protein [Verrucomicrobiota bacterium]
MTITEGLDKGRTYELEQMPVHIGRDPHCEICLPDSQSSRTHAVIRCANSSFEIEDLKSRNGTRVNGVPIETIPLHDGDKITIGRTTLRFSLECIANDIRPRADETHDSQTISLKTDELVRDWAESRDIEAMTRAKADLEALYRVGRIINSTLEVSILISQLVSTIFQELQRVGRCSIHLLDDEGDGLRCVASKIRGGGDTHDAQSISKTIVQQVLREKRAVLTYDAMSGNGPSDSIAELNIHSAICAPLQTQERIIGIIHADSTNPAERLTKEDMRLLAAVGAYAGVAIENAKLYGQLARDKGALQRANEELRNAQQLLIQSEKMAAIGQLASGVVHDVKTPMMVIMGYAHIIREKVGPLLSDADHRDLNKYIDNIEESVSHTDKVIKGLLEFAKPGKPSTVHINVNDLLRETLEFLRAPLCNSRTKLTTVFADGLPAISVDVNQIKQVFINIVMNAIQAMGEKGSLTVTTERAERDGESFVGIAFTDTGPGMTEDQQSQIFDPFYTTKAAGEGTGLGLSITYSIVKNHGGVIEVKSSPGQGATFRILLPSAGDSQS